MPNAPRAKLKAASTPSLDGKNIVEKEFEDLGELSSIAAKVLMKVLYVTRMVRFDLIQPVTALARVVSRWNRACGKKLLPLVCYISSILNVNLVSHLGDPINKCTLLLFSDSAFAGGIRTSKPTTGPFLALVCPRRFAPIAAASPGQTAASHSSTGAEIIAMEYVLRVEGLLVLDFWDSVLPV